MHIQWERGSNVQYLDIFKWPDLDPIFSKWPNLVQDPHFSKWPDPVLDPDPHNSKGWILINIFKMWIRIPG